MPDLSDLTLLRAGLVTTLIGFSDDHLKDTEKLYFRVYLRLMDKALTHYREARRALSEQVTNDYVFNIFRYTDHLEDCVNVCKRLILVLERVPAEGGGLALTREARRAIMARNKVVTGFRDCIEHLDKDIQRNSADGVAMLYVAEDGSSFYIGDQSMRFTDLAALMRELHAVGLQWLEDLGKRNEPIPNSP